MANPMPAASDDEAPVALAIDQFDLEIVEFILSWTPYGGPPVDECLPRFGMVPERLQARFRDIVRCGQRRHLGIRACTLLERAEEHLAGRDKGIRECRDSEPTSELATPVLRRGVWRWTST